MIIQLVGNPEPKDRGRKRQSAVPSLRTRCAVFPRQMCSITFVAGDPHAAFDVAGAGNVTMVAGLRAVAKAVESPPAPIGVRASSRYW
jgi:hypothetical protein